VTDDREGGPLRVSVGWVTEKESTGKNTIYVHASNESDVWNFKGDHCVWAWVGWETERPLRVGVGGVGDREAIACGRGWGARQRDVDTIAKHIRMRWV
jgi:hypothetical protein